MAAHAVMGTMEGAKQLHPVRFATRSRQGLVLQAPWQRVAHIVGQCVNAKGDNNFIHGWKHLRDGGAKWLHRLWEAVRKVAQPFF